MHQVGPLAGLTVLSSVILALTIIRQIKRKGLKEVVFNQVLQNTSLAAIAIFGFLLAAVFATSDMPYLALAILMVDLPTFIIATFRTELMVGVTTENVVNREESIE